MSIIAHFPGIDRLLESADAVVVARVTRHLPSKVLRIDESSEIYECYIEQTLKGSLRPRSTPVLRIQYYWDESWRPLRQSAVVLLFLNKHTKDPQGCEYSSPRVIGAAIELAPFGSETVSRAGTPKARVKALLRHYRQYRAQRIKREDALLQQALRS